MAPTPAWQSRPGFNVYAPCSPENGLAPRDRQLGWQPL